MSAVAVFGSERCVPVTVPSENEVGKSGLIHLPSTTSATIQVQEANAPTPLVYFACVEGFYEGKEVKINVPLPPNVDLPPGTDVGKLQIDEAIALAFGADPTVQAFVVGIRNRETGQISKYKYFSQRQDTWYVDNYSSEQALKSALGKAYGAAWTNSLRGRARISDICNSSVGGDTLPHIAFVSARSWMKEVGESDDPDYQLTLSLDLPSGEHEEYLLDSHTGIDQCLVNRLTKSPNAISTVVALQGDFTGVVEYKLLTPTLVNPFDPESNVEWELHTYWTEAALYGALIQQSNGAWVEEHERGSIFKVRTGWISNTVQKARSEKEALRMLANRQARMRTLQYVAIGVLGTGLGIWGFNCFRNSITVSQPPPPKIPASRPLESTKTPPLPEAAWTRSAEPSLMERKVTARAVPPGSLPPLQGTQQQAFYHDLSSVYATAGNVTFVNLPAGLRVNNGSLVSNLVPTGGFSAAMQGGYICADDGLAQLELIDGSTVPATPMTSITASTVLKSVIYGGKCYSAGFRSLKTVEISKGSRATVTSLTVPGSSPSDLEIDSTQQLAFIPSGPGLEQSVSSVDLVGGIVSDTFQLPDQATRVAVCPDGLWVGATSRIVHLDYSASGKMTNPTEYSMSGVVDLTCHQSGWIAVARGASGLTFLNPATNTTRTIPLPGGATPTRVVMDDLDPNIFHVGCTGGEVFAVRKSTFGAENFESEVNVGASVSDLDVDQGRVVVATGTGVKVISPNRPAITGVISSSQPAGVQTVKVIHDGTDAFFQFTVNADVVQNPNNPLPTGVVSLVGGETRVNLRDHFTSQSGAQLNPTVRLASGGPLPSFITIQDDGTMRINPTATNQGSYNLLVTMDGALGAPGTPTQMTVNVGHSISFTRSFLPAVSAQQESEFRASFAPGLAQSQGGIPTYEIYTNTVPRTPAPGYVKLNQTTGGGLDVYGVPDSNAFSTNLLLVAKLNGVEAALPMQLDIEPDHPPRQVQPLPGGFVGIGESRTFTATQEMFDCAGGLCDLTACKGTAEYITGQKRSNGNVDYIASPGPSDGGLWNTVIGTYCTRATDSKGRFIERSSSLAVDGKQLSTLEILSIVFGVPGALAAAWKLHGTAYTCCCRAHWCLGNQIIHLRPGQRTEVPLLNSWRAIERISIHKPWAPCGFNWPWAECTGRELPVMVNMANDSQAYITFTQAGSLESLTHPCVRLDEPGRYMLLYKASQGLTCARRYLDVSSSPSMKPAGRWNLCGPRAGSQKGHANGHGNGYSNGNTKDAYGDDSVLGGSEMEMFTTTPSTPSPLSTSSTPSPQRGASV